MNSCLELEQRRFPAISKLYAAARQYLNGGGERELVIQELSAVVQNFHEVTRLMEHWWMTVWRPIETAPKGVEWLEIWCSRTNRAHLVRRMAKGVERWVPVFPLDGFQITPTHWRPMSEGPGE